MFVRHDSRDLRDRSPFGAVPVGGRIRLGLSVGGAPTGARCFVSVWEKGQGAALVPMECVSWGETARFSVEVTAPEEGCLLWYCFVIECYDGTRLYYGSGEAGHGGVGRLYDSSPKSYQITVYKPTPTPEWYKNGIAYQIFPDRFRRGEDWRRRQADAQHPEGWRGPKRLLQQDWDDTPFYGRDEKGGVTRWPFFGGTLEGIREKLPYLQSLGVTVLYLNPIFEAASNHRYDTADYMRIDPALGDDESFHALAADAAALGIHIILDGVFNHTGADSRYFNGLGNYDTVGACQSEGSPWYPWYRFQQWPETFESWWGVTDLPNVEELEPSYQDFIYQKPDSVVRHWLRMGADGWRLDVADELPDEFIRGIRRAMEEEKADSVLLGEVWEDASNKESYGVPREYLMGEELHSTMNYPFRTAALEFMLGRIEPEQFREALLCLQENYPRENFYGALNLIGSHDRPRVLTLLGDAPEEDGMSELQRERHRLPEEKRTLARRRLMLLSVIQFTMPGVPCIYYGDEAGAEGYSDPFNRGTYPWGREDEALLAHYRMLGELRRKYPVLADGACEFQAFGGHVYGCRRWNGDMTIQILANRGIFEHETVTLEAADGCGVELSSGQRLTPDEDGRLTVQLPPLCWAVIAFDERAKRENTPAEESV